MQTLLFTPTVDTRYASGLVHSRIGLSADAIPFSAECNLFDRVSLERQTNKIKLSCVLVDEAQFLTKTQVSQLADVADQLNIPVLCYGLRTDFRGELFEGSHYLLAWAEELSEIKTICHCGRKATMNMRLDAEGRPVKEGEQVQIGGNESYVSTCRIHYKAGLSQAFAPPILKVEETTS